MELIIIDENKLKITMSPPDMDALGVDENEFYLPTFNARELLMKIIKQSGMKTGFEKCTNDDKILLQLYPDTHGGCELFVTKIPLEKGDDAHLSQNNERFLLPNSTKKLTEHKKSPLTYGFENLKNVIAACRELRARKFCNDAALYHTEMGKFYLVVEQLDDNPSSFSCLSEFGELENTEYCLLNSLERGECIFKNNAITQLALL